MKYDILCIDYCHFTRKYIVTIFVGLCYDYFVRNRTGNNLRLKLVKIGVHANGIYTSALVVI